MPKSVGRSRWIGECGHRENLLRQTAVDRRSLLLITQGSCYGICAAEWVKPSSWIIKTNSAKVEIVE
jgi:hypothetical protein